MNSKWILAACATALLSAAASPARARLGETPQEMETRYGPAISTASAAGFSSSQYEKQAFLVTVFYKDGHSVVELFASRGLSQAEASQLVALVAGGPQGSPGPAQEAQLRKAARITGKDEVFWTWTGPTAPVMAAFDPVECTIAFFSKPEVYERAQQALSSTSLASFRAPGSRGLKHRN